MAIEAKLGGMLDLTGLAIRRTLGITLKELAEEDWRKLLQSGKECTTQALGRAVAANRASGLLARSATVPQGVNIVAFPGANRADWMVVEGDRLTRLGVRIRA